MVSIFIGSFHLEITILVSQVLLICIMQHHQSITMVQSTVLAMQLPLNYLHIYHKVFGRIILITKYNLLFKS